MLELCVTSTFWVMMVFLVVKAFQLSLTFGQLLGQADLQSDVPPGRGILWPKVVLHKVSLTFGQPLGQAEFHSDIPPVEASSGQESGTT